MQIALALTPVTRGATVLARKLCGVWLAGALSLAPMAPGQAADRNPTPVTQRCYIDCAGGCKILRGGTDAASEEVYVPDRTAWRTFSEFMGWSSAPPSVLAMLPDLQKNGQCPASINANPEPCRLHFVRTEGFRGTEAFYNVEAGERHRVLAARESGAEILAIAQRLRDLGQCPNPLTRLPESKNGSISSE